MGWLTTGDIEARVQWALLLDLADDDGDGTPDPDVLDAVRADAEGVVEAHLAGRYNVPLASADGALRQIAAAIAVHRLHLRKATEAPEQVRRALDEAMATLHRLAAGQAHLPGIEPRGLAARTTARPEDRAFTRQTLEDL